MATRVLVVDDSALMRKHIRKMLEDKGYDVVTARNGEEGLEKVASFEPTVVTLDINMPVMDGITCLSLIMEQNPCPVIMVSSLTEKGALSTFEALELGAVDYVAKPGGTVSLNINDVANEILAKVKAASRARIGKARGLRSRMRARREQAEVKHQTKPFRTSSRVATKSRTATKTVSSDGLVMIGVSTGGPSTVEDIICSLPANFPLPILIAQHMPARFTGVFAERLNKIAALDVIEINGPMDIQAGQVLIARGDADVKVIQRAGRYKVSTIPSDNSYLWHPSVERMGLSVKDLYDPKSVICVQLTGMGNDGAAVMAELHELGAKTIAESEETAVVYGMPRELVERGGADLILPNDKIADQLIEWTMGAR